MKFFTECFKCIHLSSVFTIFIICLQDTQSNVIKFAFHICIHLITILLQLLTQPHWDCQKPNLISKYSECDKTLNTFQSSLRFLHTLLGATFLLNTNFFSWTIRHIWKTTTTTTTAHLPGFSCTRLYSFLPNFFNYQFLYNPEVQIQIWLHRKFD